MQDRGVFDSYKRLRNLLRQVCLTESLGVVRGYVQHLQFHAPLPSDLEVDNSFRLATNRIQKIRLVSEWELEALCREIIINSEETNSCRKTLKKWSYFARSINSLKNIEGVISRKCLNRNNILLELHRIAHRQFPWQSGRPNQILLTRYFKIYRHPRLEDIVRRIFGMDTQSLYLVGMAALGVYLENIAFFYPPRIEIDGLTPDLVEKFVAHFSMPLETLRQKLTAEEQMNDKFFYAYHSLRAYPLIRMNYQERDSLVCPLPTLLCWRLTNGVYYEICREEGFSDAFGEAFQDYTGEVIRKAMTNSTYEVYPEQEYFVGKNRKNTVDWILADSEASLFIETKTKRLIQNAKVEINSEEVLKQELDKMADFILQVYKTINDYRTNQYPSFRYREEVAVYPFVVTLEDWFAFGPKVLGYVTDQVKQKLTDTGLPPTWLDEIPFSICAIHELENILQIMNIVGIRKVMERKVFDKEKRQWSFGPYVESEFPEAAKKLNFLFNEDFDHMLPENIRNKIN